MKRCKKQLIRPKKPAKKRKLDAHYLTSNKVITQFTSFPADLCSLIASYCEYAPNTILYTSEGDFFVTQATSWSALGLRYRIVACGSTIVSEKVYGGGDIVRGYTPLPVEIDPLWFSWVQCCLDKIYCKEQRAWDGETFMGNRLYLSLYKPNSIITTILYCS